MVVGEWRGCTGLISSLSSRTQACGQTDGAQFQAAVERGWLLIERVQLPCWPGFTDELRIFRRRGVPTGTIRTALSVAHGARDSDEEKWVSADGWRHTHSSIPLPERLLALSERGLVCPPLIAAVVTICTTLPSASRPGAPT
jgi:hypothetical protein